MGDALGIEAYQDWHTEIMKSLLGKNEIPDDEKHAAFMVGNGVAMVVAHLNDPQPIRPGDETREAIRRQLEAISDGAPSAVRELAQRIANQEANPGTKPAHEVMKNLKIDGNPQYNDFLKLLEEDATDVLTGEKLNIYEALAPQPL